MKLTAHMCIAKEECISCTLYFCIGLGVLHRDDFILYFTDLKIHSIYLTL